ncbi:hypothetical protein RUM43_012125 [Polyplax serrata]|uniref:FYVE, RhoGEF and PH domain-containing protein 6 n=1 Tax=Polyplax serrata TaxID=468196 RepID=A0AAN8S9U0_POLSC
MEDIVQRTSGQTKAIHASNNNNNNNIVKLSNFKPPLLPKPQIKKIESGFHSTVKSNCVSPGGTGAHNSYGKIQTKNSLVLQNELPSNTGNNDVTLPKPPCPLPKPLIPPKLNLSAQNCSTSGKFQSAFSQPDRSEPNPRKYAFLVSTPHRPTRPPRSQQKDFKKGETEATAIKKCEGLPKNVQFLKNKSASLSRNEETNWKMEELMKDQCKLSEFCKQVEMCSKHSHLLKNDVDAKLPPERWKKNCETMSDQNKNSIISTTTLNDMPDSPINSSDLNRFQAVESVSPVIHDYLTHLSEEDLNSSNVPPVHKSFLHRYVNFCNQSKEAAKTIEKQSPINANASSFLHKTRENQSKECKGKSCGQYDASNSDKPIETSTPDNGDKNFTTDKEQLFTSDHLKKQEKNFQTIGGSTDGFLPFTKKFPWFGSFGKGGKKFLGKKSRCVSQFYASHSEMEGQLFQKTRTKSLPDIKHTRIVPDGSFLMKNSATPRNSSVTSISNDYPHSDSDDDKDSLSQTEMNSEKDCNTLAYLKARELMTSEEVFIDVLKLLNVDFRNYVQLKNYEGRNNHIPTTDLNKILNHLSQLQTLNEDILEDLRKRIENWESSPKISDVIVKKGAFLKMYTTYIQNFESQTNYLDECMLKYPKFGKIVKEFEASDRCKKLSLKHYMLKPVQRIPQYRLLLNDYLKHLNEDSVDYGDTLSALKIVCEVVDHANRNLACGDKEGRMMHFQSILSDYTLIKPGRELIKDGSLDKICRKTIKDRYFILLNDCLLHTTYSKQYLKIHQELPLSAMKVGYSDDQLYPHSFTVHSVKRSFMLCAKNESDCKDWVEKLQGAIEEHIKKQKTFTNVKIEMNHAFKLGKEAPVWVPDSKVTMCQICTAEFTALFRRHHCRGCGKVVCRNCGSNQAPLQYTNFKADRVCDQCFDLLLKDYEDSENSIYEILKEIMNLNDENLQNEYLSIKTKFVRYISTNSLKKPKYIPPRLKEVSANDSESTISGWLYRKSRKSWKMFWYVLKDHVLYVYKASEDVLALETIPVLGYEVERNNINLEEVDGKLIFSLVHQSQSPLIFRAESQSSADRYI